MKKNKKETPDKIVIHQKKNTWKRFVKLLAKCSLPWVWLALYILLEIGVVDLGVSETDTMAQLFAGDTSPALLAKLVGVLIINLLGVNLLVFTRQVTSARINRNMRTIVLNKVLRLPMRFFKDEEPRETIYRITDNATVVDSTIMVFLMPVFMAGYKSVRIFFKTFSYDWRLSAILLAFVPVQIFCAFLFGRINFSLNQQDSKLMSKLIQKLSEMVTNIPLAKAFAKEDKEAKKGEELSGRLYDLGIRSGWIDQVRNLSGSLVTLLQTVLIVVTGLILLRDSDISRRAWTTFFLFSTTFSGAIDELMMYWNNVKIIQGSAERLAEIMDAPEEDVSGEKCESLRGDLALENVSFRYDEEKLVLDGLSCTFADNQVTALLGVSGCGKTTITYLLTRLYQPAQGVVTAGGRDISRYDLDDYRRQFAIVSQNGMLFSGTVRENVCYGCGEVTDEQLTDALKRSGAYDFVRALPQGVDSRLEEYGGNLSGGQRQRLCMARALLSSAHYLILDEPVASMDAIATAQLLGILKEAAKDRCVIIIAHTDAVLSLSDRVVVVEDGKASAQGTVDEVCKVNAFLREMMGKKV